MALDTESHVLVSLSDCEAALLGALPLPNPPFLLSTALLGNPNELVLPPPGLRGLTGLVLALDVRLVEFLQFVFESATSGETQVGGPLLLLVFRKVELPVPLLPHEFDEAPAR